MTLIDPHVRYAGDDTVGFWGGDNKILSHMGAGGVFYWYHPPSVIAGLVPAIQSGLNIILDYPDKPGNDINSNQHQGPRT